MLKKLLLFKAKGFIRPTSLKLKRTLRSIMMTATAYQTSGKSRAWTTASTRESAEWNGVNAFEMLGLVTIDGIENPFCQDDPYQPHG